MRAALTISLSKHCMVGTVHQPSAAVSSQRVGLLLLNAGPLPRSWNSDLPCHIGDSLAGRGVHTFRFDLPGLGDSHGELPELVEDFRRSVGAGVYDGAIIDLTRRLIRDFGLKRIFIGGLCAGAIESLRVVSREPRLFDGLIMFEPDFRGPVPAPTARHAVGPTRQNHRNLKVWAERRFGRTRIESAFWLGPFQAPLILAISKIKRRAVPDGTDADLVRTWRHVVREAIPTLLLRAEHGVDWRTRRILQSFPRRAAVRSIHSVLIPNTNHMFNSNDGQDAAHRCVVDWVTRRTRMQR